MSEATLAQVSAINEAERREQENAAKVSNPKWPLLTFFGVKFDIGDVKKILDIIQEEIGDVEVGFNRIMTPVPMTQIKVYKELDEDEVKRLVDKIFRAMVDGIINMSPQRLLYAKWNNKKIRP